MRMITRFAPSPNGRLHLGHAYAALMAYRLADMEKGGQFLLRIEDIDKGRARPAFITAIYDDLAWLGLTWPQPVMRQSQRFAAYEKALLQLRELDVVYPCWATHGDIRNHLATWPADKRQNWPRDPDGRPIYPGLYRDIDAQKRAALLWENKNYAWRLDSRKAWRLAEKLHGGKISFFEQRTHKTHAVNGALYGDVIIARKDMPTSYHLAVVVDDADQHINLVTRGQDLQPTTHIHRILQILLELPEPHYFHHDLIRHANGQRLAKRAGDEGFGLWREAGKSADEMIATLPPPFGTGKTEYITQNIRQKATISIGDAHD